MNKIILFVAIMLMGLTQDVYAQKYNLNELGTDELYNIDGLCISYKQMKAIAKHELTVKEIDSYVTNYLSPYYRNALIELKDYQTPRYVNAFGARFMVRLSMVNDKTLYNFECQYKNQRANHNIDYFEQLCKDLKEDSEKVNAIRGGYRGFPSGFEYVQVFREGDYIYVYFQL